MKKIAALLLSLIILCPVFSSCGDGVKFSPIITLAEGYALSDNVISAKFYNKEYVDIYSDIKFSEGKARLYSDDTFDEYFDDGLLPLGDGESAYIMRVTSGNKTADYTVKLTNVMITGFTIAEKYEKIYGVGGSFDRESVVVTASLLRGGTAEIKDYDVVYRFDGEGEHKVIISCGGFEDSITVEVAGENVPVLTDGLSDGFGAVYDIKNGSAFLIDGKNVAGYYKVPGRVEYGGEKYPVSEIAPYCFESNGKLTGVYVPETVKSVGEGAFSDCAALESAEFSRGTAIGGYAFRDCARLDFIKLPEDITEITDGLFSECGSLPRITIPDGVTSIGKQAFIGCVSLEEAIIPASVKTIGARAFKKCESLFRIMCGIGLEKIGDGAFSYCESLKTVVIPEFAESQSGLLEGCPDVTLYSGKTSMAIYYAKKAGIKTKTVNSGSIVLADVRSEYYLGNEIGSDALTVILYTEDYLGEAPYYGIKYDFSVPGKRTVEVTFDDYSVSFEADVEYYETLSGNTDMNGVEYMLDETEKTASLLRIPDSFNENGFILPTAVISGDIAYKVTGISENAVRSRTLEKLFIHSEVKYIGDNAISDCPKLSLIFCGVRTGVGLYIGEGNFSGLSSGLCVLCEFRSSVMQNYVNRNRICYAGTETDKFYFNATSASDTSYKIGEDFNPEGFVFVYVGSGWNADIIKYDEIEFLYDFSQSNVVTAVWKGRKDTLKISVTE